MHRYPWLLLLPALCLCGCSWLLPNREKEYLSVQPLPPLKLPPDLTQSQAPTLEDIRPPAVVPAESPSIPKPEGSDTSAHYIELPQPFSQAWISVIKALDRLSIEITDRDADRGVFHIIHSTTEQKLAQDRGMWEDLLYFFTGEGELHERRYQVLLAPAGDKTRIYLLDAKGNPIDDPETLELLEQLKKTLSTPTDT